MERPASPIAGQSLVGTLIAAGVLLAMITAGFTLMAATRAVHESVAMLSADPLAARRCPDDVRAGAEGRTCAVLTVHNVGDAQGTARCEVVDVPVGASAVFAGNGIHVFSTDIAGGDVEQLLITIDGGGRRAAGIGGTCELIPPPQD
jgi:hypothetical protein